MIATIANSGGGKKGGGKFKESEFMPFQSDEPAPDEKIMAAFNLALNAKK